MNLSFGAFGKIPSLGDFFRVNLAADFITTWDQWLQQGMISVRGLLGDRWQDCYMSAPIWRFSLAGGLAGKTAMLGIIMPSVDRVGRQFPMTFAAALPVHAPPLINHFAAGETFDELETIALDALEDETPRDILAERLAGVSFASVASTSQIALNAGTLTLRYDGHCDALPKLAAGLSDSKIARQSTWSANTGGKCRLMACEGLPDPARMRGLFDLDAPIWSAGPVQ
jgi:type VI secretion system protein ImpM